MVGFDLWLPQVPGPKVRFCGTYALVSSDRRLSSSLPPGMEALCFRKPSLIGNSLLWYREYFEKPGIKEC